MATEIQCAPRPRQSCVFVTKKARFGSCCACRQPRSPSRSTRGCVQNNRGHPHTVSGRAWQGQAWFESFPVKEAWLDSCSWKRWTSVYTFCVTSIYVRQLQAFSAPHCLDQPTPSLRRRLRRHDAPTVSGGEHGARRSGRDVPTGQGS